MRSSFRHRAETSMHFSTKITKSRSFLPALNSKRTNFLKMTCFYQPYRIHLSCDFYAVSNIDSEIKQFSARLKFRMTCCQLTESRRTNKVLKPQKTRKSACRILRSSRIFQLRELSFHIPDASPLPKHN